MSARLFDQLQNFRRDGAARRRPSPPDPETSRVKRALFGPVNHEENLKFVKQELDKNLQEQVTCRFKCCLCCSYISNHIVACL